jgi:hypothetical protein
MLQMILPNRQRIRLLLQQLQLKKKLPLQQKPLMLRQMQLTMQRFAKFHT